MHLRRSLVAAASALALASTLSSCGFDYATDRVYTPAAGPIDRDATVDANVVMTGTGDFVEVQSAGEEATYSREQLDELLALAAKGCADLVEAQKTAIA